MENRTQPLDFIHSSFLSLRSHSEPTVAPSPASKVILQFGQIRAKGKERAGEGGREGGETNRTEQGPYDLSSGSRLASSRQQRNRLRPKRCGTDGGGLRHRKKGGRLITANPHIHYLTPRSSQLSSRRDSFSAIYSPHPPPPKKMNNY